MSLAPSTPARRNKPMNAETKFYTPEQMSKLYSVHPQELKRLRQSAKRFPFYTLPRNIRYHVPEIIKPGAEIVLHHDWYTPQQLAYFLNLKTHRTLDGWRRDYRTTGKQRGPVFSETTRAGRTRTLYYCDDIHGWLMSCRTECNQVVTNDERDQVHAPSLLVTG